MPAGRDDSRRRRGNDPPGARGAAVDLTPRQLEVLSLAANGLAGKQIARQLNISTRTVEAHLSAMRRRAAALSQGELIAYAVTARLIAVSLLGSDRRKARDETQVPASVSSRCPVCSRPLRKATTGRPRIYCSRACQARAYRTRRNKSAAPDSTSERGRYDELLGRTAGARNCSLAPPGALLQNDHSVASSYWRMFL